MKWLLWITIAIASAWAQQNSPGYAAYERANALFTKQQFAASLDAVEEALRLDAALVPALTLRAKLAMAAKRNDLARADLEKAVSLNPKSAYAQFLLGLVLYEQNELQLALKPFEAAMKGNARDPRAPLYLGLCQESLGDTDQAAMLYEKAIRLEEQAGQPQVETYLIAARLEMVLNRTDAAARWIDRAIRRDGSSRDARFESARLAARRGNYTAAVKEAERALALSGGETSETQIHALLARSYQWLGDTAKASQHAGLARGK
ncbi:MAG: tetratricopeptide repeat protein [Bryobacterales bacterium]|nr:tetratricopeptide repeat protein [Bryobacterales bacterium]